MHPEPWAGSSLSWGEGGSPNRWLLQPPRQSGGCVASPGCEQQPLRLCDQLTGHLPARSPVRQTPTSEGCGESKRAGRAAQALGWHAAGTPRPTTAMNHQVPGGQTQLSGSEPKADLPLPPPPARSPQGGARPAGCSLSGQRSKHGGGHHSSRRGGGGGGRQELSLTCPGLHEVGQNSEATSADSRGMYREPAVRPAPSPAILFEPHRSWEVGGLSPLYRWGR